MKNKYGELLLTWCDTMEKHIVSGLCDSNLDGGILCPACHRIHGRCADSLPAFLFLARETGEEHYRESGERIFDWSERNMKREDGSLYNDSNSSWRGITVFSLNSLALALDECEKGTPLYEKIKASMLEKAEFVASDMFFGFHPNVNYFACAPEALYRAYLVFGNEKFREKAEFYYGYVMENYITSDDMIFGEGHPYRGENGALPFDMGYNLEESLSGLAEYAFLTGDKKKLDRAAALMRKGLEFMLPDGAVDNSWGSRSNKWTYYGSRTSDGMQPGLVSVSELDTMFSEAAERNFRVMERCTVNGLLAGGLMYGKSGEPICVHHSITHSKALLAMAKHFEYRKGALPCDAARYLIHIPEADTYRAVRGDWFLTAANSAYASKDDYSPGSGGAATLVYHREAGALLSGSPLSYRCSEPNNMQYPRHQNNTDCTSVRIVSGDFSSARCRHAKSRFDDSEKATVTFEGALTSPSGEVKGGYMLSYEVSEEGIVISARSECDAFLSFYPISEEEAPASESENEISIAYGKKTVVFRSEAPVLRAEKKHFQPVGGFLSFPCKLPLEKGKTVKLFITAN